MAFTNTVTLSLVRIWEHDSYSCVGGGYKSYDTKSHLLRGDFESLWPHVDLLVHIHAGNHEEDAGPPGSPRQQPAQPEDDRSLVLLRIKYDSGRVGNFSYSAPQKIPSEMALLCSLSSHPCGQGTRDVHLTWTTLTTKTRERGSVKMMRTREKTVRAMAHTPGPSSHPAHTGHSYCVLDTPPPPHRGGPGCDHCCC